MKALDGKLAVMSRRATAPVDSTRPSEDTFVADESDMMMKRVHTGSSIAVIVSGADTYAERRTLGSKLGGILMAREHGLRLKGYMGRAKFFKLH